VALVVSASAYVYASSQGASVQGPFPSSFTVGGQTFTITSVASTQAEREQGLMNAKVTNETVMLFVFSGPGEYDFWMYDTNTSLDIIWLMVSGGEAAVVTIATGLPSCYLPVGCPQYGPAAPANYVLEAKSGFAAANGIHDGSVVTFNIA
jgi:uncharacterized membrane protein (UPF0127 family)